MASLVEAIARALVSKPEEVKVTEVSDGKNIVIKLSVDKDDIVNV